MSHGVRIKDRAFLVTGGGGFIGSHIVEALLEQGAQKVLIFDKTPLPICLTYLSSNPKFQYVQAGLDGMKELESVIESVDGIFHMAVLPLGPSNENPDLAVQVNIEGALRVFKLAAIHGVKKVIYSSASSVYGDTLEIMDESHPLNPNTFYGVSKLCAEFFLKPLKSKISYVILRYMNVYGPRQTNGLIPSVLKKIASGEAPVIYGDGSASFDFVHVSDVVRCNLLAMEADVTDEVFNVGSGEEFAVKQIVEMLIDYSGAKMEPKFDLSVSIPMIRRVGCSDKAKKILGYKPLISLIDGLRELTREKVTA